MVLSVPIFKHFTVFTADTKSQLKPSTGNAQKERKEELSCYDLLYISMNYHVNISKRYSKYKADMTLPKKAPKGR